MSSTRRSKAPRKRPAPAASMPVADAAAQVEVAAEAPAEGEEGDGSKRRIRQQVLARLEATVRDNPDLDDDGRAWLMQHYRNAVESADIDPKRIARPDRKQWIETLEALQASGLASDEDVAILVRQFDAAMEPLDSPQLRTLAEFSERVERDGHEAAVEWLESRRAAMEESKRATAAAGNDARLQPDKPAPRRVRSPRGPPA